MGQKQIGCEKQKQLGLLCGPPGLANTAGIEEGTPSSGKLFKIHVIRTPPPHTPTHTGDSSCIRASGTRLPLQNKFLAAIFPDHWHPGPQPASSQPYPVTAATLSPLWEPGLGKVRGAPHSVWGPGKVTGSCPNPGLALLWRMWRDTLWGPLFLQSRSRGHPRWKTPSLVGCPSGVGCRGGPVGRGPSYFLGLLVQPAFPHHGSQLPRFCPSAFWHLIIVCRDSGMLTSPVL